MKKMKKGWEEVGRKNKTSTVQEIKVEDTSISLLFSGRMRSLIKKKKY